MRHKLPPIVSHNWRRITFIITTGDRFETAEEINDLFETSSTAGRLYVTLKEEGFHPERNWPLREQGITYQADLALPLGRNRWLPIVLTSAESDVPATALCLSPDGDLIECVELIRQQLSQSTVPPPLPRKSPHKHHR